MSTYICRRCYTAYPEQVCALSRFVSSQRILSEVFFSLRYHPGLCPLISVVQGVLSSLSGASVCAFRISLEQTLHLPPSSLFASTSGSFFFQKTNSNLNPCSASLFASNTKIFLQHYPMTIWWAITFWNRYVSNYKYKSYTLLSCFPLNVLWEKNLGVVILLFENMMNY